jgi:hypothetical protein
MVDAVEDHHTPARLSTGRFHDQGWWLDPGDFIEDVVQVGERTTVPGDAV